MEKFRSRKFCILLYPDNKEHMNTLDIIQFTYDCVYILHDKDVDDTTGEIKKPHYHVIVFLDNAKWNTALSNELDLPMNFIQKCRNEENAINYLIHFNDDSKYQYDFEEVKGDFKQKNKLKKVLLNDDLDENDKALSLIEYIHSCDYIQLKNFATYCSTSGRWDIFRRSAFIFIKLIEEHNERFKDKEVEQTKNNN